MRAALIHQHGGLECVKVEEIAEPELAKDEVVLEVRSAGLNHLDIWIRKGREGLVVELPHVIGSDAAGVVIETGRNTHGINIGDEVILNPGLSCGCCESCYRGEHSECVSFGLVGVSRSGTFAEKVAVPFYNLLRMPQYFNFDEAAALGISYQTAWRMLMTRAKLQAGETILIHGIGGGVALAALQLAKLAGAEVIVTSSSDEKLARAVQIGADHTINYKKKDVVDGVKAITNGRGADIAFDTVGAATWDIDMHAIRRGGRIVLCGVTTGAEATTNLQMLYWNQLTILGSTMGSKEDFAQMLKAMTTAKMKPIIDSVKPLESIQEAMGRMEAAEQFGKIILKVSR
jgi:NADPH:quinone reductase-like Zn-dependent oxidoreductase